MGRWGRCVAIVALLFAAVAYAQQAESTLKETLLGTWQGTVQGDRSVRVKFVVLRIDGKLKGKYYNVDQGGGGTLGEEITVAGDVVKIPMPLLFGNYEGKLSADRKSMAGTWSRYGNSSALTLEHVADTEAWAVAKPVSPIERMDPKGDPSFEAFTVKPSNPSKPGHYLNVNGREFTTHDLTLQELMTFAWGLHPKQIVGLPEWATQDRWDLMGKPDLPGAPSGEQWQSMLRKALVERFSMKLHQDKKELSVYTLNVAKGGPKMTKSEGDPDGLPGFSGRGPGIGLFSVRNATMDELCRFLQQALLDRPVVNQTSLPGRWDFMMKWTPDETQFGGRLKPVKPDEKQEDQGPDLYTMMQQDLGLKLEATKTAADVYVIDHIERPSDN